MRSAGVRGAVFFILGFTALSTAVVAAQLRFVAIAVGLICFLLGATALSRASRIATAIFARAGRSVGPFSKSHSRARLGLEMADWRLTTPAMCPGEARSWPLSPATQR